MKSAVQFLIALFIVLTMVIPTGLAAADESFIVFTGDREEYKYSDPLYVRNNGENRVAYCYNASKKVPPTWQEGGQTVYKIESATAEEFYQMTDENVRVMEPEAFKKAILSVCYQGFPQNGSGLMEKYGLTRATFRCITQLAVWYYTDSLDISQHYQQYQPFDTYPGAWAAYQELITPLDTLPLGYQLDLYRNRNEQYQNVLCTRLAEMPVQTSIQLKGIKLLEGRALLANEFHFIVTDEQGTEVSRGVNHADGSIAFNYIEYRHEDVGLHRYTIREVQGDLSNVTYDGASYTVEVLVEYVDDQLTATAQGEPKLVFRNVYDASPTATPSPSPTATPGVTPSPTPAQTPVPGTPPATGDESHPVLWALLALAALSLLGVQAVLSRKTRKK